MRIKELSWQDSINNIEVKPVSLADNVVLLVGASGVGKTHILRAIDQISQIANGQCFRGISWSVVFECCNGLTYRWEGCFDGVDNGSRTRLLSELITCDGVEIYKRDGNDCYFDGVQIVSLLSVQSAVYLLQEESLLSVLQREWTEQLFIESDKDALHSDRMLSDYIDYDESERLATVDEIRESNLPIETKLFLSYKYCKELFQEIEATYTDIFPYVESIKIEPLETDCRLPLHAERLPHIQIKERGVEKWISQNELSAGMFLTLLHIARSFLSPVGSVILIDEFENSLGVNCLNYLTTEVIGGDSRIQFIVTSHHPYIINNIDPKYWRLVTRSAGAISADPVDMGRSNHDNFIKLINHDRYMDGIDY